MLDSIGTIAIVATMIFVLTMFLGSLPIRPGNRLAVTAVVAVWTGLAVALGAMGEFADADRRAVPLVAVMFAAPLIATAFVAWLRPAARAALLGLPMPLLIGLNVTRVFGVLFVLLAIDGRLGGPFPHSAGWGDFMTGALALPVAWFAARVAGRHVRLIGAWNAFGALDLVVAVFLGVASSSGSALQLIDAGAGSAAMQQLPWVLVPTVLVPFFLITHGAIFAQLLSHSAERRAHGAHETIRTAPTA